MFRARLKRRKLDAVSAAARTLRVRGVMRVKRARKVRKYLRYYRTCHGFRAPYKVLCDGNFLHAVSQMKLGDAKDVVVKYLGSPAKLFTTRCVQHELRGLGAEFKEASFAARKCEAIDGGPGPPAPAAESVAVAVADGNAERFLVCTQDETLRRRLARESPMTPVLFCHTSGLQMEPPAEAGGSGVATRVESGAGLGERERASLGQEESARDVARVRTNVRYAKPKARGPNPLACKKKREREPRAGSGRGEGAAGGIAKKKRKRK